MNFVVYDILGTLKLATFSPFQKIINNNLPLAPTRERHYGALCMKIEIWITPYIDFTVTKYDLSERIEIFSFNGKVCCDVGIKENYRKFWTNYTKYQICFLIYWAQKLSRYTSNITVTLWKAPGKM